jgi:HAD superfamily hydrolase (TIGR01509 family)
VGRRTSGADKALPLSRRAREPRSSSAVLGGPEASASMVRAVLFDLFETLITESGAPPACASSLGPELGYEREAFRAKWRTCRPDVAVGRLSLRQALAEIAARLGRQPEEATLQRVCQDRIRAKAAPFEQIEPQILRMIDHLRRRGLRLGVVSNCFAEDVVAWPQCSLSSHFDSTVFSFEVGLAKPDPEIYLEATHRLGVQAADTWFIGDGAHEELSGAERTGLRPFRALWFLRRWPNLREERCSAVSLASVEDVLSLVEQSTGPPNNEMRTRPARVMEPRR